MFRIHIERQIIFALTLTSLTNDAKTPHTCGAFTTLIAESNMNWCCVTLKWTPDIGPRGGIDAMVVGVGLRDRRYASNGEPVCAPWRLRSSKSGLVPVHGPKRCFNLKGRFGTRVREFAV